MGSYKLNIQVEVDLKRIWFRGLEQYGENQADAYIYKFFDRFELNQHASSVFHFVIFEDLDSQIHKFWQNP